MNRARRSIEAAAVLALLVVLAGCPAPSGGGSGKTPRNGGPDGSGGPTDPADGDTDGGGQIGDAPATGAPDADVVAISKRAPLADEILQGWVKASLEVPPEAFAPGEGEAPSETFRAELSRYLVESSGATSMFLLPAVDPHRGAKAGVSWRAKAAGPDGLDLLRCDYEAGGYSVRLTEGVNLLVLRVQPLATPPPPLTAERLKKLIETFVRTQRDKSEWVFELPAGDLSRGTHQFNNTGAPPVRGVATRDDRADVLVVEGRVFLVFYKRIAQRLGFERGDAWFRDSTRKAIGG